MCPNIIQLHWAVLVFTVFTVSDCQDVPDVTLISYQISGDNYRMICVANGTDSAITWNSTLTPGNRVNVVSEFVPKPLSNYNCDIDSDSKSCNFYWKSRTGDGWEIQKSLDGTLGPVTDRRWEDFNVQYTNGENKFQNIAILVKSDFVLHISIRIEKEAHIALCDHREATSGKCYWILLGGFGGTSTLIRKCAKEKIPKGKAYPRRDCRLPRVQVNHDSLDPVLDSAEWRHFTINKIGSYVQLWKLGEETPLLNYIDPDPDIEPTYLNVMSRDHPAFWKLHDYEYTVIEYESRTAMGEAIYAQRGSFCIALFVTMCSQCSLILQLTSDNFPFVEEVTVKPKQGMLWQEEKLVTTIPEVMYVRLVVQTVCESGACQSPFWALDTFRICSQNEIRVSSITGAANEVSCQTVKYPHWNLRQTEVQTDIYPERNCPLGTFGKSCISCSAILGGQKTFCENSIICDRTSEGNNICRCSAGFTGASCKQDCPFNQYGFNCQEQCGYCAFAPCNFLTGSCASKYCLNDFSDVRCKTPPFPVFIHPPTVLGVGHTFFTVQIQNGSFEGNGEALSYRIQYMAESQSQTEWSESESFDYYYRSPITIDKLNISTTYVVRAIIFTPENKAYVKQYVRNISVATTCAVFERKDISTASTNTSITLTFQNNEESCALESFEVHIGNTELILRTFFLNVNDLKPATTYHVVVRNKIVNSTVEIDATTAEGEPEGVEDLIATNKGATSLSINWKQPRVTNGIIRYYDIHFKHTNYIACGNTQRLQAEEVVGTIQEKSTNTVINNLHPYSEYTIEVAAVTIVSGKSTTLRAFTTASDILDLSEIPTIKSLQAKSTTADITLEHPSCDLIKGPIAYDNFRAECTSSWCSQNTKKVQFSVKDDNLITVSELQPYCNYTAKLNVARKSWKASKENEISWTFTTDITQPYKVINLTVYSKNETSVSLRFLPPFPPTGMLERYSVKYWYYKSVWSGNQEAVQFFNITNCKLWTNFHCITLHDLVPNEEYVIQVSAKNRDTHYGPSHDVKIKTIQESPRSLENFTCAWDDFHNLTLSWNHPSITNGPLTKFVVEMSASKCSHKEEFPINEQQYKATYRYVVPMRRCYSSVLTIRSTAFNAKEGLPAITSTHSPPRTPTFGEDPTIVAITNTTVTIDIPAPQNLESNSTIFVIVSTPNTNLKDTQTVELMPEICNQLDVSKQAVSWIVAEYNFTEVKQQQQLVIGNGKKSTSSRFDREINNQVLLTNTTYTIYVVALNEFASFKRCSVTEIEASTANVTSNKETMSLNAGLFALLLLLLVPIIVFIYIRRKKKTGVSWSNILHINVNVPPSSPNPDVIPLTTKEEKKPEKSVAPSQLRPKRVIPATEQDIPTQSSSTATANSKFSKPVKIMQFEKYVKESIENGELERQHQLFPRGQTKPWDYGLLPQNKSKNRYNNLVAYDHTRVKLARMNNDPYSDYINANYVQGYNTKKAYIATQGPKVATVDDFWRMIWQENVNHIIMLANVVEAGKKKTEQYWPNVNEYLKFGDVKVEYVSSRVYADYEYRAFVVSCKNEERRVEQLHFTSWPDHAVPLYSQSLVPFLRKLLTIPQGNSPIVVHCSAGVGRTGTIILIDLCLRMAAREGVVDLLKHQHNLREQRANMVDNIEQYKLAHLVLLECLIAPQTSITCDEEMEGAVSQLLESERVAHQMLYLSDTAWQDQAMRPVLKVTPVTEWEIKNRFQDIVPSGYGRVYLSRYPAAEEHSDYINAIEVDGFKFPQRFIVTQQPLPHTISDFWRMVDEKEVTTVVSLNKINLGDETSCVFWPTAKVSEIRPVAFLTLKFYDKSSTDDYSVITIHLHNNKDKKNSKRTVSLIILKGWPANKLLPDEEEPLLKLWEETERVSRGNSNPIVVTCYDGAKACGVFVGLSFVVEKMKLEQECDVCLAVRTVRHNRKQFVNEIDQFRYLYRAAVRYLSRFDLYSNFTPAGKK